MKIWQMLVNTFEHCIQRDTTANVFGTDEGVRRKGWTENALAKTLDEYLDQRGEIGALYYASPAPYLYRAAKEYFPQRHDS